MRCVSTTLSLPLPPSLIAFSDHQIFYSILFIHIPCIISYHITYFFCFFVFVFWFVFFLTFALFFFFCFFVFSSSSFFSSAIYSYFSYCRSNLPWWRHFSLCGGVSFATSMSPLPSPPISSFILTLMISSSPDFCKGYLSWFIHGIHHLCHYHLQLCLRCARFVLPRIPLVFSFFPFPFSLLSYFHLNRVLFVIIFCISRSTLFISFNTYPR